MSDSSKKEKETQPSRTEAVAMTPEPQDLVAGLEARIAHYKEQAAKYDNFCWPGTAHRNEQEAAFLTRLLRALTSASAAPAAPTMGTLTGKYTMDNGHNAAAPTPNADPLDKPKCGCPSEEFTYRGLTAQIHADPGKPLALYVYDADQVHDLTAQTMDAAKAEACAFIDTMLSLAPAAAPAQDGALEKAADEFGLLVSTKMLEAATAGARGAGLHMDAMAASTWGSVASDIIAGELPKFVRAVTAGGK